MSFMWKREGIGRELYAKNTTRNVCLTTISPDENFSDFKFEMFTEKQNICLIESMFIEYLYKAPTTFQAPCSFLGEKQCPCPQKTHIGKRTHKQNDEWLLSRKCSGTPKRKKLLQSGKLGKATHQSWNFKPYMLHEGLVTSKQLRERKCIPGKG